MLFLPERAIELDATLRRRMFWTPYFYAAWASECAISPVSLVRRLELSPIWAVQRVGAIFPNHRNKHAEIVNVLRLIRNFGRF